MSNPTQDPRAELEKLFEDAIRDADWIFSERVKARALVQHVLYELPPGWQSIETAPQDGTAILGWTKEFGWRETHNETYPEGSPGHAQGLTDRWWTWSEPVSNWAFKWKPTHWMPLPKAPL